MAIPSVLNRSQFHGLMKQFTGGLDVRRSTVQKMLKDAGVHRDVMYGSRFNKTKTVEILSKVKGHLQTSYKEKGFGLRGKGKMFSTNPEQVYRQHVRQLSQQEIAQQNQLRTEQAQKLRANQQQAAQQESQRRVAEARQRLRTAPAVSTAASSLKKTADPSVVPASRKAQGPLRGEAIAARTGTAIPEQNNPVFYEKGLPHTPLDAEMNPTAENEVDQPRATSDVPVFRPDATTEPAINPLEDIEKEGKSKQKIDPDKGLPL